MSRPSSIPQIITQPEPAETLKVYKAKHLFPLALTPLERGFVAEDSEDYPLNTLWRLTLKGRFDRERLATAVKQALVRHPLLAATVSGQGGKMYWQEIPDPTLPIIWLGPSISARDLQKSMTALQLDQELGFKLWLQESGQQTIMTAQFHKACVDHGGASRFLEDVLGFYHVGDTSHAEEQMVRPVDPYRLKHRARLGVSWWRRNVPSLAGCLRVLKHLTLDAIPMQLPARQPNTDGDSFRGSASHRLTSRETEAFLQTARHLKVAANDLFIRDWSNTLDGWNRAQGASEGQPITVCMPVDLRKTEDALMPATNIMSMCFLHNRPAQLRNRKRLLRAINRESRYIKRNHIALTLPKFMRFAAYFYDHGLLMGRRRDCFATTVVASLGRALGESRLPRKQGRIQSANIVVENIEVFPTLRKDTHTSLAILSYHGQITICLSYDNKVLTNEDGKSLLNRYVQALRQSITEAN